MADFNPEQNIFRSPKFRSVVQDAIDFLNQTQAYALPLPSRFIGGGVYALYYHGDFNVYSALSKLEKQPYTLPIYVGKAVPSGWRTGRVTASETGVLHNRLREHSRSIKQAQNLGLNDFRCKFMILNEVESDLIVLVEAELIRKCRPLWNMVIDGFGNHDPGSGRYNQAKSEWDVLHPGRPWADRLTGKAPLLENVVEKAKNHLESLSLP